MMLGIRFFTSGKDGGTLRIDLDKVIPASTHDLKIITSTCEASTDCNANINAIHDHIALKVHDLRNEREALDPERNKAEISKINALIKRYINNNDQLVKGYGVEAITDEGATIKLTAAKVYSLVKDGTSYKVEERDGWTFTKDGFTFEAYKDNKFKTYVVMLSGTGLQLVEARTKGEIIASVTPKIINILTSKGEELKKAYEHFNKYANKEADSSKDAKGADDMKNTKKAATETKYFEGIKTLEELRNKYRDLIKINHPDNGGALETMQEINSQYDAAFKLLKSGANLNDEKTKIKWSETEDAAIREALNKVVGLKGLNIEIVGCWIWIDGETFPVKEVLKEAGYQWSRNRQKWHFAPYGMTGYKKGGKKQDFDTIRRKYGSTNVENEGREELTKK